MELDFVSWLAKRVPPSPQVRLGIGDDAALLDLDTPGLLVTTDVLVEGVHFLSAEQTPERIGRKAMAVNLSDLAAMAAYPLGITVGLVLPREGAAGTGPAELARRLIEGMLPLAERFDCPILGGDTNLSEGPLVVSVTAFGKPGEWGVLRRDGARPGDRIVVTGRLGGSLHGKHLDFMPRMDEAIALAKTGAVTAAMDLSDGLAMDLHRLAKASGVGAIVDAAQLPVADEADDPAWRHALTDGEDFELLLTLDAELADALLDSWPVECGLTEVGILTEEPKLLVRTPTGNVETLEPLGYEHR